MIISDVPDTAADRNGKLLSSKSGELLFDLLSDIGVSRKDCYITHAVRCKSPEGRPPSAAELKTCLPYLEEEIQSVKPQVIIPLGAIALKALTRKAKITELHGQVLDYKGYTLFPTFHPGMALRDPGKLQPLRKDIQKLGFVLKGELPSVENIHWAVIRNYDQWNEFIGEYSASKLIALDIETTGLDPRAEGAAVNSIQVSLDSGRNFALPLSARDSTWNLPQHQQFLETLVELSEGKVITGQNFKFDNMWLWEHYELEFELTADTMLMHHILDENSPHGLKEMASEYCNAPNYDVDLKTKLGQGDMLKFYKYGCFDTYYTLQLYKIFRAKLLKNPILRRLFYKLVMPAARMFFDIEKDGLCIDVDQLNKTQETFEGRKVKLLAEMNKLAGKEVNWNSPQQVGRVMFEDLGLSVLEKTATGAPSTGESIMLRLKDEHPLASLLVEYRGVEKNLGTYILGWKKLMHGDRLYMSTKIHGTVTGRFASRLHQVPRDPAIRSHIIAPDGYELVVADYSQIELRLAAMVSGDRRMRLVFQTEGDIHVETASVVLSKSPDKVTKEERKMAKAVNFGLIYGMGWPKLVIYARDNYGVDMNDGQARAFRIRYFETYNALPKWHERQRRAVKAFGEVSSLSGRVRRLPGVYSSEQGVRAEAERQAINSPIQGFGSGDLKAMAMVEIHRELPTVVIKGEVHDSILMWIKTNQVKRVVPKVKKIMESPSLLMDFGIKMTVPLVADFEIGPWGKGLSLKDYLNEN